MLYAFLLEKAKIPHKIGLVANRYAMRYSPIAKNGQLYDFDIAVIIEVPGAPPYVLQPGDFSMDFSELPFERQEALVFMPPENGSVKVFYSPINSLDKDLISWKYNLEMDRSGAASGTVSLEKIGAPASEFRNWQTLREIHQRNPKIKDREKSTEQDLRKELESEVEKAFFIPGDQFTFSGQELVKCELSCKTPIVFKAKAEGKGIGQASGERWLIAVNPLMLGFKSGYERTLRTNPIWNSFAGRLLLEGELLLPPGAKVLELPKPQEVSGPSGVVVRYAVEQVEREGRISLQSHMEYDIPLIVGSNFYASYKSYLDAVARLSQNRCIVKFSDEKVLE